MRDYQKDRRARKQILCELYALGFTAKEIALNVAWSRATIAQDLRLLGGMNAFPNRPKKPGDVFAAVLRRYAEIAIAQGDDRLSRNRAADAPDAELGDILAAWLKEESIMGFICGIESSVARLEAPSYPPEKRGYAQLLGAVSRCRIDPYVPGPGDAKTAWRDVLADVADGREIVAGRGDLEQLILQRLLDARRANIMPIWDDHVFRCVDDLLERLDILDRVVIYRRFGIGGKACQTLEQIGKDLHVIRERVRQIDGKALRELRNKVLEKDLSILMEPAGTALQRELSRRRAALNIELVASEMLTDARLIEDLLREVYTLPLSVRTDNCLTFAGIRLVGELVQVTKEELLKRRHFGNKSLREVTEVLGELGLEIGMNLDARLVSLIQDHRRKLDERLK
ncbi:hypothetical protein KKD88_03025 [Patescibacteria group bacterium]|nr:hypothetical protein [Patescibacteria group bacterium]MBU1035039.1 hypothetical protein [Patescibacteria group bacterium]MBU1630022.1 hypothetical protein [Patescibacteria group bacterium]